MKVPRVDRILREHGVENPTIFYSPRKLWWHCFMVAFGTLLPFLLILLPYWRFFWLPLALALLSYVLAARSYNSIAFTTREMCIVNPYFPFRRFIRIPFSEIRHVTLSETESIWFFMLGLYSNAYLKIEGSNGPKSFRCAGQACSNPDWDATRNTFDSIPYILYDHGVKYELHT